MIPICFCQSNLCNPTVCSTITAPITMPPNQSVTLATVNPANFNKRIFTARAVINSAPSANPQPCCKCYYCQ